MILYVLVGSVIHFLLVSWGLASEIENESFEQWPFWPTVKSIFSCGNKLFIARETTFISAVEKHHYLFPGWKWPQKWNKCIYWRLPYYQFASCPWCGREGGVEGVERRRSSSHNYLPSTVVADSPGPPSHGCWGHLGTLGLWFSVLQNFTTRSRLLCRCTSSLWCHWLIGFLLASHQTRDLSCPHLLCHHENFHGRQLNTVLVPTTIRSLLWKTCCHSDEILTEREPLSTQGCRR